MCQWEHWGASRNNADKLNPTFTELMDNTKLTRSLKVKSAVASAKRRVKQEMRAEINFDSGAWRELSTDLKKFLEIVLWPSEGRVF